MDYDRDITPCASCKEYPSVEETTIGWLGTKPPAIDPNKTTVYCENKMCVEYSTVYSLEEWTKRHLKACDKTLRPCPCCGHRAEMRITPDKGLYIFCLKCNLQTQPLFAVDTEVSKFVVGIWNSRTYYNEPTTPGGIPTITRDRPV